MPNEKYLNESGITKLHELVQRELDKIKPLTEQDVQDIIALASPDTILENNSWATIRKVCEAGRASDYWSVGDVKMVTGGDGYSRPVMIVDMSGLYGKHVVFQFRQMTSNNYAWNPSTNIDDNNCCNNYLISDMNVTNLVAGSTCYNEIMSAELGAELTNTTFKVAKNGTNSLVVDVTNKLFLPAEREIFASRSYSRQEEWNALSRFQYYAANDSSAARTLVNPSTGSADSWWLRSPFLDNTYRACRVYDGNADLSSASIARGVAPCFSF